MDTAQTLLHWWQRAADRLDPPRFDVAPGPRGLPLIGSLPGFAWGDPLATLLAGARDHGDVVRFRVGPFEFILVNHPDHVRYILQENSQNFRKSFNYDELKPVLGEGLVTSDGDHWLRQRRLVQPAFHRQRLAGFASVMTAETRAMLARWDARPAADTAFDVAAEMMRLTLAIVGRTLFSVNVADAADEVGRAIAVAQVYANDRTVALLRLPHSVPTPANRRFRHALGVLDRLVYGIIDARRAAGTPDDDLLSMLLAARDEKTGEGMDPRQVRDEVMTLILAGHETTANALTWTFYLLSRHPAVARRLAAELAEVLHGRVPTLEDLPNLRYTAMVLQESMRLYPPVWILERQARQPDEIGGFRISPRAILAVSAYTLHRHPTYWENPEGFDPERFAPENAEHRPRYAYIPFSGGPRVCIGNQFATMEAQLVLATIAQRYQLDLVPGHPVVPEPLVTLRPRYGMQMVPRLLRN